LVSPLTSSFQLILQKFNDSQNSMIHKSHFAEFFPFKCLVRTYVGYYCCLLYMIGKVWHTSPERNMLYHQNIKITNYYYYYYCRCMDELL